jgi:hypothetical protein
MAALFHEEEEFVRRVDDDRAGPLRPFELDRLAQIHRIDATLHRIRLSRGTVTRLRHRSLHSCSRSRRAATQEKLEEAATIAS